MKAGSLFSGIGGFDLGLERAGIEIAWQCEIDPFCNKVLEKHWPDVVRFKDVRDIGWPSPAGQGVDAGRGRADAGAFEQHPRWTPRAEGLDLIVGGFPCQDVSVAGKRAGLAGDRSGLWFEFQRVLLELRPRWAIIENVPGLLSSNNGRDFGAILSGLGECGFGGIAWAVLDSQHFGVAQRRRRVFIVCGPTRRGVEQVLALCESCGGHPQTGREARQDVAYPLGGGTTGAGRSGDLFGDQYVPDLTHQVQTKHRSDYETETMVITHALRADGFDASEDGTGRGTPLVFQQNQRDEVRVMPVAGALPAEPGMKQQNYVYAIQERAVSENLDAGPDGKGWHEGVGYTLEARNKVQSVGPVAVRTAQTSSNGWGVNEDGTAYTLDGAEGQPVLQRTVRRLTPVECERLQGFPDGWTDFPGYDPKYTGPFGGNKGVADGPRYKALGNAVTVSVAEWLGLQIKAVEA